MGEDTMSVRNCKREWWLPRDVKVAAPDC